MTGKLKNINVPVFLLLLGMSVWGYSIQAQDKNAPPVSPGDQLELLVEMIGETEFPSIRARLLRGMLDGLEGRRNLAPPSGWNDISPRLATSGNADVRRFSMELSQLFGDTDAINRALQMIQDQQADIDTRRSMLRSLLNQQNSEASSLLESLMQEPELIQDAIRGYAIVENDSASAVLLERYKKMTPAQKRAVVETLSSRETYARKLLVAMKDEVIARDDIPAHVARSLAELLGDAFTAVYGEVRSVAEDRVELIAKYKAIITDEALATADASNGRAIFTKTCAACHSLYGEGGKVGPDLTGSNRANLDYILLNSVAPSFDVPDAYKTVRIITINGRIVNGVLAEEDDARVILKTAEEARLVISKEDIDERNISPKSMMPDGQLDKMKPAEVVDLIKYLRTVKQVDLPK